ncbi:hypothetical protein AOXY_G21324 [Acipenser oxyrinchus oxyrinchus]|uniref:Uncharacterized protein n=1 Tax=Acipenser oxyrinchus oxyrinchus TaxID=40147 RepID=A0AAD8CXN0_ACIOX|nr:hypothetical protein AOXY_G21324 [Acipenser oxyrinchus oxyrinchus]
MLYYHVMNRVRGPFERFRDGIKTLGLLQQVKTFPAVFSPLFCHKLEKLIAEKMDNLFSICFSPEKMRHQ